MKTILLLALLVSVSTSADVTPPPMHQAIDLPGMNQSVQRAAEQAARAAQNAVKQMERVLEVAQSKLASPVEWSAEPLELVDSKLNLILNAPGRSTFQPLIIRTSELEPGAAANLQEDLIVMSRILTKTLDRQLGREGRDSAMGIVLSTLPGSRRPHTLYLEGYGALFLLNVKFPLVPAPTREEDKPERPSDTSWEEARREVFGQGSGKLARFWSMVPGESTAEYDAEQVEALKDELMESLKSATNVRGMKPEEWITISVMGTSGAGVATESRRVTARGVRPAQQVEVIGGASVGQQSTLTLQAKKADIDAFAKGSLDAEQFKKRVAISAYY